MRGARRPQRPLEQAHHLGQVSALGEHTNLVRKLQLICPPLAVAVPVEQGATFPAAQALIVGDQFFIELPGLRPLPIDDH